MDDRSQREAYVASLISTVYSGAGVHASWYASRNNYLDLDPTYKDIDSAGRFCA
jgi:hypothetical protein